MHKGRLEFFDPVTQSRKPAKAGSIVDDDGLEYAPEDIEEIEDGLENLGDDFATHKDNKAL